MFAHTGSTPLHEQSDHFCHALIHHQIVMQICCCDACRQVASGGEVTIANADQHKNCEQSMKVSCTGR
eukprot:2711185-Rhodomonas_salina.1